MKFDVLNRWTGDVKLTAEIECDKGTSNSIKLGLAVKWAVKNNANLSDADLRNANLRSADLSDANLSDADLRSADLRNADLSDANLWGADLRNANLWDANLWGANLSDADLRSADLRSADLRNANLRNADLWDANLWGADLRNANLSDADLSDADLRNADLSDANLWGANLSDAKNANICVPISFVGNELRTGYAIWVENEKEVYVRLGCFWDTEREALEVVGKKYGKRSSYCQMIRAACRIARERTIINPTEGKEGGDE